MLVMIAKLYTNYKTTGYRVLDTETLTYFDYDRVVLRKLLQSGEICIQNLKFINSRFSTAPTSIDLYPVVGVNSKTSGNLVLFKYVDGFTYYAADRDGAIHTMTLVNFLKRFENGTICNVSRQTIENARAVTTVGV